MAPTSELTRNKCPECKGTGRVCVIMPRGHSRTCILCGGAGWLNNTSSEAPFEIGRHPTPQIFTAATQAAAEAAAYARGERDMNERCVSKCWDELIAEDLAKLLPSDKPTEEGTDT